MGCRWSRVQISPPRPIETRVDSKSSRVFVSPRFPSQNRHCAFRVSAMRAVDYPALSHCPVLTTSAIRAAQCVSNKTLYVCFFIQGGPSYESTKQLQGCAQ